MSLVTQTQQFIQEVRVEFSKVTWPTRNEVRASTIVVIIAVLLISIFIGIIDRLFNFGLGFLFG